eukprot:m.177216 g.177216  ORF g.177216 m.177216 type:complete len:88 (-) comp16813_c0_seq2:606-869(-)
MSQNANRHVLNCVCTVQEHLYPILLKILQRTMIPLMRDHTLIKCVSKEVHDELTRHYGVFVYSHFDKVENYKVAAVVANAEDEEEDA